LCALARQQRPARGHGRPPDGLRGVDASGHPAGAHRSATRSTGCTVATSWLALIRQASAVSGRSAAA
jgi:hypothetical protein